ncbi:MAG: hypothetical protein L0Z50_09925 [Verrucomicrobiales bacterium]|nr:hypothetical protein [Verrucomicrobiales bacterium]
MSTVELTQALGLTEERMDLRRDEREHKRSEATGRRGGNRGALSRWSWRRLKQGTLYRNYVRWPSAGDGNE